MSKYFKIDRSSREIIIDKTKSYNVNVDILDLIIDLQLERDKYKNIINELEKYLNEKQTLCGINQQGFSWGVAGDCLKKLQELKEGK